MQDSFFQSKHSTVIACLNSGDWSMAGYAIHELSQYTGLTAGQLFVLAKQALQAHRYRLAATCAERALEVAPATIETTLKAASIFVHARRYERAVAVCNGLGTSITVSADVMNLLAYCHAALGNFGQAESLYQSVLSLQPDYHFAVAGLVKCRRYGSDAIPLIEVFRGALTRELSPVAQAGVHYAIAKLYNDVEDYEAAWDAAANANALMRRLGEPEQASRISGFVERLLAEYPRRAWPNASNTTGMQHVLVVGMPRSGTTLVEQILVGNPAYFGGGEVPAIEVAKQYFQVAQRQGDRQALNKSATAYIEYFSEFDDVGNRRIINKVPGNFLNVGFFKQLFPDGKVIYVKRDVRDVAASVFFEHFGDRWQYTTSVDDVLTVHRACARVMSFWAAQFPDDLIEVDYASLVRDHDVEVERLWRELDADASLSVEHTTVRNAVETPSLWQVRQGLFTSSIGRWRRYKALAGLSQLET